MSRTINNFYTWFFETGDARVAAALRIAHSLLFLYFITDLYPSMDLIIGHAGLYGTLDPQAFNPYHPLGLLYQFDSPLQLQIWFWTSVIIAIFCLVGLFTRVSIVLLLYSVLLLQTRNPHMLYGADQAYLQSLIMMVFLASDRRWSLDQFLRRRHGKDKSNNIQLWPVKIIQIQVALVYLIAGLSKLITEPWLNGSAVYYALSWHPFAWRGAHFLLRYKPLMVFMDYYTLIAEITFPFLIFRQKWRWLAIGSIMIMHFGIDILMNIKFFALSMYMGYLAFIRPSEWEWLAHKITRRTNMTKTLNSSETLTALER